MEAKASAPETAANFSDPSEFLEELEREADVDSYSGTGSYPDGQIATDSDEEVDIEEVEDSDEEGVKKTPSDSAAYRDIIAQAAVDGAGSDGDTIRLTSQDGSRLFSVERPVDLGSSLRSFRPTLRANHLDIFTPSNSNIIIGGGSDDKLSEEEKKKLEKLQQISVKFLRLIHRLGYSPEEPIVKRVLYRLTPVAGVQIHKLFSLDAAKGKALQLEAEGTDDLNLSLNILVLGKLGVGKSATINSIFDEEKSTIHAFQPATTSTKEITGTVVGVKIRVIDTPGLKSSGSKQGANLKVLSSLKRFMKKCPPDIVLYVDRLDTMSRDLNDLPLLRTITSSLGSSIWRNAIVTLTHAASAPPDGQSGSPLSYEEFIAQRSHVVQQSISQAAGDLRLMTSSLMSPVSLVENHMSCSRNRDGQKVLPNGLCWIPQLLLLSSSMKIISEANSLSKPQESYYHWKVFGFRVHSPPLPYLLSSLLQSRTHPKLSNDPGAEMVASADNSTRDDDRENESPAAVTVPLPDMVLPASFDGDNPAYRYRFLVPTSQFLARPVLDTHGWDHDCGYDGVNLEHSTALANRFPVAVAVQVTKEKREFYIQLDSSVSAKHGENGSSMAGFDIQNVGTQLAYTIRSETKLKTLKNNMTAAGIYVTFLGENVAIGVKLEDQVAVGKQLVLAGSTGMVQCQDDAAYGANLELRLRDADYPIGQDKSSLGLSLLHWRGDLAFEANLHSQISVGQGSKIAVRAGFKNTKSGQISVRISSSDHVQIALAGLLPIALAIHNIIWPELRDNYTIY